MAKYTTNITTLKMLWNDRYVDICAAALSKILALTHNSTTFDKALSSRNWYVRKVAIPYIIDPSYIEYRKQILNDMNHFYGRFELVPYATNDELDVLVHDENKNVRIAVAKIGRPKDLDFLVDDEDIFVRMEVANHRRVQDLRKLVHDNFVKVRVEVARVTDDSECISALVKDDNVCVRRTAVSYVPVQYMYDFLKDKDEKVIKIAEKRIRTGYHLKKEE